jgi:colanic acid/amylovoran biosynthesis protein
MNWGHQDMLLVAKKLKKPLFYYGRSIGPFWDDPEEKKYFKQRSQEILKYCSYVSLRESESIRIAHELGVANVVETTDTAFLDAPEVTVPSEIKKEIGRSPYVVFVPNLLIWHYYYRGRATKEDVIAFWCKIVDVINEIKPECKIVMLPQTFNYGSYEGDDIHLFHDIQAARSDSRIIVVDDQYSSDVQQQIIRSAEAVFGARYHSVVFAINNNVPFIAFSYEHKIAGLLEELGLQNAMIDIKPLFGSTAFNNSVIDKFSEKLTEIHRNPNAQLQAKEKAKIAFNLFVKKVREAVR